MTHLDIQPLSSWTKEKEFPMLIAGPCSAESETQMLQTAKKIAKLKRASLFRAGIWKPRTRPGTFEGVGEPGLEWMQTVKRETGLAVTTEVASTKHVEACLKAGVDVLWIGARTTVNPFLVQEIVDSLKGVDIPVMIKNPVNPDVQLWSGALERANRAGLTKLAVIHRGFTAFTETPYRNKPEWSLPIDLKRQYPELPMFCDPSHIAGVRDLIPYVCQKALDLSMDGLMIETHIEPDKALSDAKQQVTPEALGELLKALIFRKPSSDNDEFRSQLGIMRGKIDTLDEEILQKFSARMKLATRIGQYKKDNDVTILQIKRWDEILAGRKKLGETMGLEGDFLEKLLELVHQESIRIQTELMNQNPK